MEGHTLPKIIVTGHIEMHVASRNERGEVEEDQLETFTHFERLRMSYKPIDAD